MLCRCGLFREVKMNRREALKTCALGVLGLVAPWARPKTSMAASKRNYSPRCGTMTEPMIERIEVEDFRDRTGSWRHTKVLYIGGGWSDVFEQIPALKGACLNLRLER